MSTWFYEKEREKYITFGYKGLDKQSKIADLSNSSNFIQVVEYSKKIIDDFIDSNDPITKEVCYAINSTHWAVSNLYDNPLSEGQIRNYNELAYKNNCGDVSGSNYASDIMAYEDNPDYTKVFEILANEVKSRGGSYSSSYIAELYEKGLGLEKNIFIAYVLYQYRYENTYETLGNTGEFYKSKLSELSKILSSDQLLQANLAVNEINNDYTKIFKYIHNDLNSNESNLITVKKVESDSIIEENKVSDFQKEVIKKKSRIEKKQSYQVKDILPPQIILSDDINVSGLVAILKLEIKDEYNIAGLFVDGVPIIIPFKNDGRVLVEQTIFVGSENKEILIEAYDKWGNRNTEKIQLNKVVESFNINYGDYYALIIGNNDYDYLPKLNTAINDANKISSILNSNYNFKEVILLENASRKEILVALYDLRKKLSFKDNLFIYYAGHGEIDRQINEGYWQPVDALPELPTEWIDNNTITSIIGTMKAKHVLIIADSCYSGLLTRSGNSVLQNTFDNREILLQRLTNKKSRLVFTSGGKEPVQDGGGGSHSIFAKSLIDVLEKNTKEITLTEIAQEVIPYVITNSDQTPEFAPIHKSGHDGGDFIFVPKN